MWRDFFFFFFFKGLFIVVLPCAANYSLAMHDDAPCCMDVRRRGR